MTFWFLNIFLPVTRWLHIVGGTLLLGGTFFFEFVVPEALEDLKPEQQLGVLGRFRWIFRRVVVAGVLLTVVGGLATTWRMWAWYNGFYTTSRDWAFAHIALGLLSMAVALRVTLAWRAPSHTQGWMRLNVVVLLIVVFLASVARHVRLTLDANTDRRGAPADSSAANPSRLPRYAPVVPEGPSSQPEEHGG